MISTQVTLFSSAYPGSMFKRDDGQYIDKDDNRSLAAALLHNMYEAQLTANDWRDSAIGHEKQFHAMKQQRDTLLALIKRYRKETPIGNQPHMIAHQADEAISAIESSIERAS